MNPILYAINIGTFATWLSVAGLGTVSVSMPIWHGSNKAAKENPYDHLKAVDLTADFTVGEFDASIATDTGDSGQSIEEEPAPYAEQDTLMAPPDMPELADLPPLPEVPNLPAEQEKPVVQPTKKTSTSSTQTQKSDRPARRSSLPTSATGGSTRGQEGGKGKAGNGGVGGGSGMSDAKRLAGGRMPAPRYPAEAKSKGQTGTVIVEFIVAPNGRVISAYASPPCPWPVLNDAAVRAVQGWRFPASDQTTKYRRPIKFNLN